MSEYYTGEIRMFAGDYAPRDWALCNGQTLMINEYQTLFSLIGTTYGGDGRTTFALPDLRKRLVCSAGQAPGLSPYILGQNIGTGATTLSTDQLPLHTHIMYASTTEATTTNPSNTLYATCANGYATYLSTEASDNREKNPDAQMLSNSGGRGEPHNNIMPCLALNYIIALMEGTYPSTDS
ncbi:MAG: phage tail protein [Rhodospirillaceae bacterium]|nr:phage tail protein [Rhodospirillaceae bacterium]